MGNSLADQLLKAGLVDQKKVKDAQKAQRKQAKQQKQSKAASLSGEAAEAQARLARQRAEKAERDRQLNLQRQAAEKQKALQADIRQILEKHGVRPEGDIRFNFTETTHLNGETTQKVKQVYVSKKEQDKLAAGVLAICRDRNRFVLVPGDAADKLAERDASIVVFRAEPQANAQPDEDDPYKDYVVPDDLMW